MTSGGGTLKELKDMTLEELWRLFPIILKKHNHDYAAWYEEERDNLLRILSGCGVCRVNHIGSTAVDGLLAKPIVDILLELPAGYEMDIISRRLADGGWLQMYQDSAKNTLGFNKGYTPNGFDEKVYHLHVKPMGDWGELYFRDYLRQHPDTARQYEALKRGLLKQFKHDRDAYTNEKSSFVEEHTQKARAEFPARYLRV
jgi:GrpB-like predicted nucleotidyltransferase (UPF0157 family)